MISVVNMPQQMVIGMPEFIHLIGVLRHSLKARIMLGDWQKPMTFYNFWRTYRMLEAHSLEALVSEPLVLHSTLGRNADYLPLLCVWFFQCIKHTLENSIEDLVFPPQPIAVMAASPSVTSAAVQALVRWDIFRD